MEPIIEENLNRLCRVANGDVAYFIAWIIERPQLRKLSSYDMMSGKAAKSKTFYGDTIIACVDRARCAMVYKRISEAMEESND